MDNSVSYRWYVYTYAYPDGTVFYVGKGQGHRINAHLREARKGTQSHKCSVIRKIWREGGEVRRTKVAFFDDEDQAFLFEQQLIIFIGRENLTNATDGGEGASGSRRDIQLNEFGKYLEVACELKAKQLGILYYTWPQLAFDSGTDLSLLSRSIRGKVKQPKYETVTKWFSVLKEVFDAEFEDNLYNIVGYPSPRQHEQAEEALRKKTEALQSGQAKGK